MAYVIPKTFLNVWDIASAVVSVALLLAFYKSTFLVTRDRIIYQGDLEYSMPHVEKETVPVWLFAVIMAPLVLIVLPLTDYFTLSLPKDTREGFKVSCKYIFTKLIWGFAFGYLFLMFTTEVIKQGASSPRPDFLARCNPDWSAVTLAPSGALAAEAKSDDSIYVELPGNALTGGLRRLMEASASVDDAELDAELINKGLPSMAELDNILLATEQAAAASAAASPKRATLNSRIAAAVGSSTQQIAAAESEDNAPVFPAGLVYTVKCKGDAKAIKEGKKSFPSGHSTSAFYAFTFPIFVFDRQWRAPEWTFVKFTAQTFLLSFAAYICASRYADYWHRPIDIIAGAILGTFFAWWAERVAAKRANVDALVKTDAEEQYDAVKTMRLPGQGCDVFAHANLNSSPAPILPVSDRFGSTDGAFPPQPTRQPAAADSQQVVVGSNLVVRSSLNAGNNNSNHLNTGHSHALNVVTSSQPGNGTQPNVSRRSPTSVISPDNAFASAASSTIVSGNV